MITDAKVIYYIGTAIRANGDLHAACRVADLRAAVTHVVNGCGHVALGVSNPYKPLDAVILECGGNLTVRTALLDGLQGLATAIGMGSLNMENISKKQKGSYPLIFPIEV